MSILRYTGTHDLQYAPKKASTVLEDGQAVVLTNGFVEPANATSTKIDGIAHRSVKATDTDYTSTDQFPFDVPTSSDLFEADVTGTLTTAMRGNFYGLSADGKNVDVSNTTKKHVEIVQFISASKAIVRVNAVAGTTDAQ